MALDSVIAVTGLVIVLMMFWLNNNLRRKANQLTRIANCLVAAETQSWLKELKEEDKKNGEKVKEIMAKRKEEKK